MKKTPLIFTWLAAFLTLSISSYAEEPLFVNSIVSTDFDFILDSDPNALESIQFVEFSEQEMPDSRNDDLFAKAYIFSCRYSDNATIQIWAHEDFGSQTAAQVYVSLLANAIGQQPHFNRVDLDHVVLHQGDAGAYAEEEGKFFVLYSDNMDTRISNHDLQETVFHESAHVAFETDHATHPQWISAQQADSGFITDYAENQPTKEDIPESALFAFVLLNHPGRLPAQIETAVRDQIPSRIAYFEQLDGFVTRANLPPPKLRHNVITNGLSFQWISGAFKLQYRNDLSEGTWHDYPAGNTSPVTVNTTNRSTFFRLIEI